MLQTTAGINNKDKRQNFSMNQQAHLKHNLHNKNSKQVDVMLNSAYSLKTTTRKSQMKGTTQQISKKML